MNIIMKKCRFIHVSECIYFLVVITEEKVRMMPSVLLVADMFGSCE